MCPDPLPHTSGTTTPSCCAVVHACAERVQGDYMLAASMCHMLSMAPFASRTPAVQAELHLLRTAAGDAANKLKEAACDPGITEGARQGG